MEKEFKKTLDARPKFKCWSAATIESSLLHNPNAVLIVLSNTSDTSRWTEVAGPKIIHYRTVATTGLVVAKDSLLDKVAGAFTEIDAVFIRGGQFTDEATVLRRASRVITTQERAIAMDAVGAGTKRIQMDLGQEVSLAKLNVALSRIRYLPPKSRPWKGQTR